ncbi:hypothetical protein [Haliscomenobacter sp.]|uniref:hypothetical protein n=1 Tax=Haliscomenobacter sp. TaxID=2717303 RepID=UPI003BA9BB1A
MEFRNQTIFIISYEGWGEMWMSKHHYAFTLSQMGNDVYFINHPDLRKELNRGQIKVIPTGYNNLTQVKHRLIYPFFLKFSSNRLYNFLTSLHIKRIIRHIGKHPDIVWSFDSGNPTPIKYFKKAPIKIYMPVDGPFGHIYELKAAEGANVILSVTNEILSTFLSLPIPKYKLSHGVSGFFIDTAKVLNPNKQIRIGYSGSLIRNDLDIDVFFKIINDHPDKIFEFWGEIDHTKSNIHLEYHVQKETLEIIETLRNTKNVILHGAVKPEVLAEGIKKMDALLICYKIKNDQNHHKVLEYLGTGKVIISSYMTSYDNENSSLMVMAGNGENEKIPSLFNEVMNNLDDYNSLHLQQKRISFAEQFTYQSQINKIESYLNQL